MSADATPGELQELADGVWAWIQPDGTWWVNNAGAIRGDDGLLIVDTCATERRTRAFLTSVAAAAPDAPIRWAMNTHTHGDHTYGNSLLPADAALIGHEHMRAHLLTDPVIDGCPPLWEPVPEWGNVQRRVPSITLRDALDVHLGGRTVELLHPGHPAHTTGDAVAWLPDEQILFSGDLLFHGLTPLVFMGSLEGAIRSLAWIDDMSPRIVVPGHGPVISDGSLADVLADHERYYRLVLAAADRGISLGLSPLEAARSTDLGEFAHWADSERLVPNLHRAYADRGVIEVDILAALGDAIAWAGRAMQTSV